MHADFFNEYKPMRPNNPTLYPSPHTAHQPTSSLLSSCPPGKPSPKTPLTSTLIS